MQYELYSMDKCGNCEVFFYHLSTNSIKAVFFYIYQVDAEKKYIIVDNYSDSPLNYRMLKLEKPLNKAEYKKFLFECKKVKYIDILFEQNYSIEETDKLYLALAQKETDLLLNE